ncbi:MAG: FtsH protease activity modulator HflK [Calditrichaeota bacterium]|nr:MAG: FtsH protease activity modulator HflK [Calditrichota bacterium]MBL1204830.1 FtsH protease activity modulator HflK [Calditrichota bacterium]NOG44659.1 FtsH protease activity modulator HflK [Calditrichota bacterium]
MAQQQFDLNNIKPPNISGKTVKIIGVLIVIVWFIFSSVFTIEPEEVGVILRFGKYSRTVNPGLNFKFPFGVETMDIVPVKRQQKEEFGFKTAHADVRTRYVPGNFKNESLMLTGDLNAAQVEWIVQYRISDPYLFLFKVRNAAQTLRDVTEAVMREVVGDRTVNEIITVGRQDIEVTVTQKLQEIITQYETGINIDQVILQDVNPPDEVKASFNEVNEAEQEKESLINQAKSEYNKVVPRAKGQAEQQIEEAKGYALERVNNAKGEANRFTSLYREYAKAKEVTRQRMYLETMEEVLSTVGKKVITDDQASGILPLFNFNQEGLKNGK